MGIIPSITTKHLFLIFLLLLLTISLLHSFSVARGHLLERLKLNKASKTSVVDDIVSMETTSTVSDVTIDVDIAMSGSKWFPEVANLNCSKEYQRWEKEKSNSWYSSLSRPLIGCNYIPSFAVNQLEHWQHNSFDTTMIRRELFWAKNIGINTVRVFLHYLPFMENRHQFLLRIGSFLSIADSADIKTVLVLFDDCWGSVSNSGKQPDPIPGVHNSGWLQCPDKKLRLAGGSELVRVLHAYTLGVLQKFRNDSRVLMWDLWNEPGQSILIASRVDHLRIMDILRCICTRSPQYLSVHFLQFSY